MLSLKQQVKVFFVFARRNLLLFVFIPIIIALVPSSFKYIQSWFSSFLKAKVKIGMVGKYTLAKLPPEISQKISFGLTKLSPNGTPEPAAAISWEIKEQGKQYIFHLDPFLHWQNHNTLNTKDINYKIEGVTTHIIDNYTLSFSLESPFAPLPSLVSTPLVYKGVIGLGDYRIRKFRLNGDYLSNLILESQKIKSPSQINYHFYPGQKELLTAFKLGEVDCIHGVADIEELKSWPRLQITPRKETEERYVALFFNTTKQPFAEKRFRQALAYGFRKPEEASRALTPISPLSWAYNKNVKTYPFDPQHAQEILNEAQKEATPTGSLKIKITSAYDLSEWADIIKKDWETYLGLQVEVHVAPVISASPDFDVILGYGLIPSDPDQYPYWHSGQPGNMTGFSNPRIDKLLEDGRTTLNKEERKRIYSDFQRYLLEELPAIFLFYPTTYDVCRVPMPV